MLAKQATMLPFYVLVNANCNFLFGLLLLDCRGSSTTLINFSYYKKKTCKFTQQKIIKCNKQDLLISLTNSSIANVNIVRWDIIIETQTWDFAVDLRLFFFWMGGLTHSLVFDVVDLKLSQRILSIPNIFLITKKWLKWLMQLALFKNKVWTLLNKKTV